MYQAFNSGLHFYKGAVIGYDHHAAFDDRAHGDIISQRIPGMRCKLLQAQGNTFLGVIKVKDDHVDLLVKLYDFIGMVDPSP